MAGGASIADIFFRAFMEDKDLQLQAMKAGDKAGQTMGSRMSKGISAGLKVGLGVIAAGAAIATRGLVELDDTMAQFTADTGLAGEAADDARKSILEMAGDNLQPMREIGKVLGKVHTDLGLTGEAADDTAEAFLHFARITKRDATEEVAAFDDILDAWGLTAGDSVEIMDKLVASHQKYGGSIEANESALSGMAPQLKALNLDIDDGIGLLNLFATSGLDAAAIPKALNSAIKKLDGRPLEDFVAELAGIEDPGLRAQRAMEVFGTKAGAGLANAIKPGMTSLDNFKVSTEEATGAMERGRDAIDGTFGNRAQLVLKKFGAKLVELGQGFGPVLTGLASIASLGGAAFSKQLAAGIQKVATSSVVRSAAAAAGSAIGAVYGAAVASAEKLVKLAKDAFGILAKRGIVKAAAERAGLIIGAIFGAAAVAGERLAGLFAAAFAKLPFAGALRSAVLASAIKVGTFSGTAMGTAAGVAFRLGFLGAIAAIADEIAPTIEKAGRDLGKQIPFLLKERTDLGNAIGDFNRDMPWPLGMKGAPDWAGGGPSPVADLGPNMANDMREAKAGVTAAAAAMVAGVPGEMDAAQDEAVEIAAATPFEVAKSLREGADPVKMAAELLKDAIENALLPAKEIAQLNGELTGQALKDALNDKRPEVRAAAQAWKVAIEERLFALQNSVPATALATGQTYADALDDKHKQVGAAATVLLAEARSKFTALKADAATFGDNTGDAYGAALAKALKAKQEAVLAALRGYRIAMRAGSPPKPGAVLYGIEKWGAGTGDAYVDPFVARLKAGVAKVRSQLAGLAGTVPSMNGPQFAMAGMGAAGTAALPSMSGIAGDTITRGDTNVNVQLPGLLRAETPTDVVRTLRHLNVYGTFRPEPTG